MSSFYSVLWRSIPAWNCSKEEEGYGKYTCATLTGAHLLYVSVCELEMGRDVVFNIHTSRELKYWVIYGLMRVVYRFVNQDCSHAILSQYKCWPPCEVPCPRCWGYFSCTHTSKRHYNSLSTAKAQRIKYTHSHWSVMCTYRQRPNNFTGSYPIASVLLSLAYKPDYPRPR